MIKNKTMAIVAGLCLGIGTAADASYLATNGDSSLRLRTADTVARGERYLDLMTGTESYIVSGNNRDLDVMLTPGFVYGFSDNLDLAVTATRMASDRNTEGVRDLTGLAKYRLWESDERLLGLAVSAYDNFYTADASKGLGSGDSSYGAALNLSITPRTESRYHLLLGSERSDERLPGTSSFVSRDKLIAGAGVELRPLPELEMSFEALASHAHSGGDDNVQFLPSLRYQPGGRVAYSFGLAYGVPSDRSKPEYRFNAGLSVGLEKPDHRRKTISARVDEAVTELDTIRSRMDGMNMTSAAGATGLSRLEQNMSDLGERQAAMQKNIDLLSSDQTALRDEVSNMNAAQAVMIQQLGSIEKDIKSLSTTVRHTLARVEVENASGIKGLGERVAEILIRKGYEVTSVSDVQQVARRPTRIFYTGGAGKTAEVVRVARADLAIKHQTRIFYIEGFIQRATRVSMILPGSQAIVPDKGLKNEVEIKVVVGKDMRALVKRKPSA